MMYNIHAGTHVHVHVYTLHKTIIMTFTLNTLPVCVTH